LEICITAVYYSSLSAIVRNSLYIVLALFCSRWWRFAYSI